MSVGGKLLFVLPRRMRWSGKTLTLPGVGSFSLPSGHAGRDPAAYEFVLIRIGSIFLPPPCGVLPVAFMRKRLASGLAGTSTAAAFLHQVDEVHFGFEAEEREFEAVLAGGFAVEPPLLQPSFVNTGTTWLVKLSGRLSPMFFASSGVLAALSPKVAMISLVPLARGSTRPNVVTAAVLPSATVYCTSEVMS